MKSFEYTIKDSLGIHARPAGMLAKAAKALDSEIIISLNGRTAVATKLMSVMGLGVKCGDTVTININGGDESSSEAAMQEFFKANL